MTLATPTRRGEQDYPHSSEAASAGRLRLSSHADDADVADWRRAGGGDDSRRPVLSLSRDGDSTQRWYVPSAAGLLVVEVAT